MPPDVDGEPVFTVLLVCTGNLCRSAMAERLGRAYLRDVLGGSAAAVRVESAGMQAVVGSAMHPDSARVLAGFGVDPGDFRARQFAGALADSADLILAMTRTHRRLVLERAPRALARTFTLREAAALLELLGEDVDTSDAGPVEHARALVARMAAARSRRLSAADDDVADPIGLPLDAHQTAGDEISEALLPILARLADVVRPATGPGCGRGAGGSAGTRPPRVP